jgi:hypothetical protein
MVKDNGVDVGGVGGCHNRVLMLLYNLVERLYVVENYKEVSIGLLVWSGRKVTASSCCAKIH